MGDVLKEQNYQTLDIENTPQRLEQVIEPVISSSELSNEQKIERVGKIVADVIAISHESFSGPMPHPNILQGYKELIPNAPERILQMAEQEQRHRIEVENAMLKQNDKNITESAKANKRSQTFAFVLTLLLIGSGVTLTIMEHATIGGIIFSSTIICVTTVFITGKRAKYQKKEDSKQE